MRGTVKSKRKDGRSVCIEYEGKEQWFDLADNVKSEYIPDEDCECSVDFENVGNNGNPLLTYIKGTNPPIQGGYQKGSQKPQKPAQSQNSTQDEEMHRMSAVKSSSRIYEGTGQEDDFKRLTDEVLNYVKSGTFK